LFFQPKKWEDFWRTVGSQNIYIYYFYFILFFKFFLSYFVYGQICNATPNKYHSSTLVGGFGTNYIIFENAEIFIN